jgi:hypothetical protein
MILKREKLVLVKFKFYIVGFVESFYSIFQKSESELNLAAQSLYSHGQINDEKTNTNRKFPEASF